ncbi:MAG: prepilin-type N-terminal cleavage/methylation domain-containing protein [Phycisphaeraceae bacterium]
MMGLSDFDFRIFGLKHRARRRSAADGAPPRAQNRNSKPEVRHSARGFSLVEMLISLAITAMLLTATMVAIDASFRAYAAAAESASTQTATRLVTHRLLTMLRTSTAHGPLMPDAGSDPPVVLAGNTLESHYLELIDARGNRVRVEYREDQRELWLTTTPHGSSTSESQPLLGGVASCTFHVDRRFDREGVWVLERATMDILVEPDRDTSLTIESSNTQAVRYIASTMPRKLE